MNAYFCEDGQMDKRVFLNTWKEIPAQNEVQFTLTDVQCNPGLSIFSVALISLYSSYLLTVLVIYCFVNHFADTVVSKMQQNNVFTIAKRNVEGQDMLYQSLKLTNGIWVLNELKIQPGNPNITVSVTTVDSIMMIHVTFQMIGALFTVVYVKIIRMFSLLQLSLKTRALDVAGGVFEAYDRILHA